MVSKVIFCALFTIVVAQRQQVQLPTHGVPATDDGDDGSWTEEKYEAPVSNDVGGRQFSAQPQYRPQPQPRYQAPAPQPQYRPQPQPQYQPPAPEPQYRPQPQAQQYDAPAPQPQYRPQQQPQAQPQYRPPAQQYRPQSQQQYSQSGDSRNAAILSEARYLQGDGKFGAAYTQEDGVEFKEESDADGTRRGTYSWVDPTGERRTVSYVAGKNGFQATGAHLPVGPAQVPPVAPQPQYTPLPQYNPPPEPEYRAPQPQYRPQHQYNPPPQPQYQPAPQYNPPAPRYNPPSPQPQYNPPAPQPQYNPPAPQPQYNPPAQQPQYRAPSYTTTPPPHRFFPPGKLSLNRSPDGYSYTFNKA